MNLGLPAFAGGLFYSHTCKYKFVAALSSCLEIHRPIYHRRIFEHLGETLDFLKAHFRLKFCVFQPFYYLRSMLRVQKTPVLLISVSLMWAVL